MGDQLILETTFLVDVERELRGVTTALATAWLERHRDDALYLTFTVAGELACGESLDARDCWEAFLAPFQVLPSTPDVCWEYGQAFRYLRDNGMLIGANDLWIAATGLANGMGIVTRNVEHFRRIPGLKVLDYAS